VKTLSAERLLPDGPEGSRWSLKRPVRHGGEIRETYALSQID